MRRRVRLLALASFVVCVLFGERLAALVFLAVFVAACGRALIREVLYG